MKRPCSDSFSAFISQSASSAQVYPLSQFSRNYITPRMIMQDKTSRLLLLFTLTFSTYSIKACIKARKV